MRILALSTASPALSLALFDDGTLIARTHDIIGRGHAEALMPAIARLLGEGRADPIYADAIRTDAIIVDIGPGSFTGIRIGIAAARALGLAWDVPVTGCTGAALIAAQAFALQPQASAVTVLLNAGRGQILRHVITRDFSAGPIETVCAIDIAAGEVSAGAMAPPGAVHHGQPDAGFALHLPLGCRDLRPLALYIRPPDAVLPL